MNRICKGIALSALFVLVASCGGAEVSVKTPSKKSGGEGTGETKPVVAQEAAKGFNQALDAMVAHDKAHDWTDASCTQIAKQFEDAASLQKSQSKQEFPEALYDAGLAYQRCDKDDQAKGKFQEALNANSAFHHARVQLALYTLKEKGDSATEQVIAELKQAVADAKFQNVEALVNLAMLQMKRGSTESDQDGASDLDRAKKNLQRALAIDDGYQPAFNQLALYYLNLAKANAGRKTKAKASTSFGKVRRADVQQLELAALVCSQAIRKNPNYAAVHNTAGLIQVELQNINSAVQEFQAAAKLDPEFFEAQMNYAAINLSFRGFAAAENAYRAALKIRSSDYDAHLGLALAIRGQIDDSNFDKRVADAQSELDQCKKIAPDRPETYYNEAILTQEYKAKGGGNAAVPAMEQAASIFETFISKAAGGAEYTDAVKRSKERVQDIRDTLKFIKEGQSEAAIEAAKQEQEMQQDQAGDGGAGAAPAEAPEGEPTPAAGGDAGAH